MQLFAALQFIIEEKYMAKYKLPPLLAVGLEGFWGIILSCIALPLCQLVQVRFTLPVSTGDCMVRIARFFY